MFKTKYESLRTTYDSIKDSLSTTQREIASLRLLHLLLEIECPRLQAAYRSRRLCPNVTGIVTNLRKAWNSYVNPTSSEVRLWISIIPFAYDFYIRLTSLVMVVRKQDSELEMTDELRKWVKGAHDKGDIHYIHETSLKALEKYTT